MTNLIEGVNAELSFLMKDRIDLPPSYSHRNTSIVIQDGRELFVVRFERSSGVNNGMGGEHFSVSMNVKERRIEGVMHIDEGHVVEDYCSQDEARELTVAFLEKAAPELAKQAEIKWIAPTRKVPIDPPHDSPYLFFDAKSSEKKSVVGMRVKLYDPTTNGYGWCIWNKEKSLVAFERDIGWDRIRKCRTTEQWLHDEWVIKYRSQIIQ